MILLRGIAFPTSVFDILLIVVALGVGLFILRWVLVILYAIYVTLKHAVTGRWKELDEWIDSKSGSENK